MENRLFGARNNHRLRYPKGKYNRGPVPKIWGESLALGEKQSTER